MIGVPPVRWASAPLSDLGEIRLGKMLDKAKNTGSTVQYLRNINVRWFRFDLSDLQSLRVSESEQATLSVQDDDLFICEGGEPGRCAVWHGGTNSLVYQKALHRFRTFGALTSRFLMYQLRHQAHSGELLKAFSGTTIKHLTRESLCSLEVLLPPTREQKRIADKLDAVLGRVHACRDRLDRVPAILKRFRQSVLAAATSGGLTEEWRDERRVGDDWVDCDVQSIAQVGTGSTPLRSNPHFFASIGMPWITSAATSQPVVLAAHEYVTDAAIAAHRLRKYPIGTLLIAMYGEGRTRGQVTELGIEATINQACAAVVVDPKRATRSFVKLALQANYLKMRALAEGGNQPNLNLSKVKAFPLRLPSIEEQTEIVRSVESLFAWAGRLEARHAAARAQIERLTPALLAKAFRGELVPQDPADEPASELLERQGQRPADNPTGLPKRQDAKRSRASAAQAAASA